MNMSSLDVDEFLKSKIDKKKIKVLEYNKNYLYK